MNKKEELVILVDENDNQIGLMPKMEAHQKAVLHRAFSVFVFNDKKELLMQQRAAHKYHSPNLWTNTCCSHQREGESNIEAGKRRLFEEMGMHCDLTQKFHFIYKAPFDNGLTEHELDHVLIGYSNENPQINCKEVSNYKWMTINSIKNDIFENPNNYTAWFKIIFKEYLKHLKLEQ
ncbi:MAG TPA: isopentenyl-diphosphate Delta-isomerase [Flavobacteriia bacterium]|nr:isopentenyl-diphosphate Delta-isomerase [Flavobacteriia bacterium]